MAPASEGDTVMDYYELLGVPATASESEIRRAYRKTSLLYHPDKVKPTPETLDRFQLLQTALNVLADPAEKAKYDSGREAKLRRQAENAALESRRRKMKRDLERKEVGLNGDIPTVNGTKRTWSDRELAIKRIAEENRRRREVAVMQKEKEAQARQEAEKPVDDTARSVKVRWIKEGENLDIDATALTEMFPVGDVEDVLVLKDKKRRIDGRDKKMVLGMAVIIFSSLLAAKRAVTRGAQDGLESVTWMSEKENEPT